MFFGGEADAKNAGIWTDARALRHTIGQTGLRGRRASKVRPDTGQTGRAVALPPSTFA